MPTEKRRNQTGGRSSRKKEGKLLLIGGNEDKTEEMEVLRALAAEAGGAAGRIEVITTASSEPELVWQAYERAFKKIGVGYAKPMHIASRAEAEAPKLLKRIAESTAILFTGGDQLRITSILGATPVAEAIRDHFFSDGGLVAGTSAGAAALTGTIIYDGESPEALRKGAVMMTGGLALIRNAVVHTHFVTRGRIGRLIQVVAGNPRLIGIGLGEDTGVLVTEGTRFKVVGSGLVIVVDGASIGFTDVFDVGQLEVFSVENVRVHVISAGAGYDLEARAFQPPPVQEPAVRAAGQDSSDGR
ncbi:MAG: cyanophycinase [Gemmatimonadetes bacterium]|nr:cyanophycinase [Gemmatimonadota bacterium]